MPECKGPCDNQADVLVRFPYKLNPDYRNFCEDCYAEIRRLGVMDMEKVRTL